MKSYLIESRGFTLLEMLVVLLLVSLLSAVIMQGFIYLTSIYGSVERRQNLLNSQSLLEGWLRYSGQSIVNGMDGESVRQYKFAGGRTGFESLASASLSYRKQTPVRMVWEIKESVDDAQVELKYAEIAAYSKEELVWYTVAIWPKSSNAGFSYFSQGVWYSEFPERLSVFSRNRKNALPDAIRLRVDTKPIPIDAIIYIGGQKSEFIPPIVKGVM